MPWRTSAFPYWFDHMRPVGSLIPVTDSENRAKMTDWHSTAFELVSPASPPPCAALNIPLMDITAVAPQAGPTP